jgi:cytochrome c553
MMKSQLLLSAAAVLLLLTACADPLRSRDVGNPEVPALTLARQVCSNCHGVTGDSLSPNFPKLAGQPADYLVAELKAFRDRSRGDPAARQYMWGLTRHLSDDQIAGLARYYASQSPATVRLDELPPGHAEAGRELYEHGAPERQILACATCHGSHGEGLATFPRLAGQHPDYLATQLKVFQQGGERPEGGVMEGIARRLTPPQVEDLAAYVAPLGPSTGAHVNTFGTP